MSLLHPTTMPIDGTMITIAIRDLSPSGMVGIVNSILSTCALQLREQ